MILMIALDGALVVFMVIGRSQNITNTYEEDNNNFCNNFVSISF